MAVGGMQARRLHNRGPTCHVQRMVQSSKTATFFSSSITGGKRICPHCSTQIVRSGLEVLVSATFVQVLHCIACKRETVSIASAVRSTDAIRDALMQQQPGDFHQVIPSIDGRPIKVFRSCPADVQESYAVASRLAGVYPPAAAAMARKAIEMLLDHRGYRQKNLVDKLEALGKETDPNKRVSTALLGWLEALRLRTHSQNSTVAARAMADRKTVGHRS